MPQVKAHGIPNEVENWIINWLDNKTDVTHKGSERLVLNIYQQKYCIEKV